VEKFPDLRIKLPKTAHVKLGHVLQPLEPRAVQELIATAQQALGAQALVFREIHMPAGTIPLSGGNQR
jgi:hypothetical protein